MAGQLDKIADQFGGLIVPPATGPVGAVGSWRQVFGDEFGGSSLV
jgi:hypothetical protein